MNNDNKTTREGTTLYIDMANEYGQMKVEEADKFIAAQLKNNGVQLTKDFTPYIFVTDETDPQIYYPCRLGTGKCWVVTKAFSKTPAPLSEHPTQPEQTDDTYIDKLEREIFRTQKQVTKKDIEMEELKEQNKLLREALAEIHGFLKVLPALRLGNKQGFDECVNIEGVKELELLASKALNQ